MIMLQTILAILEFMSDRNFYYDDANQITLENNIQKKIVYKDLIIVQVKEKQQ